MAVTDPLTKAMWNWATYHRRQGGQAKTREDWASWGPLGEAMYDWGKTMYDQNLGELVTEEGFQSQIALLRQTYPLGGALGKFYALPPPAAEEEPAAESQFGPAADAVWDTFQKQVGVYGGMTRQALVNAHGDLGGATWDWLRSVGALDERDIFIVGNMPQQAAFRQIVSYLAYTFPPGGSQGFVYAGAPNAQQQQQQWQNAIDQKKFEADEAFRQANLALQQGNTQLAQQQLALAQKAQGDADALAQAQLAQQGQQFNVGASGYIGGQATLDRQRIEADIKATQDRIRIAEQQGNAQLALDERKRLDALQIALAQSSGYVGGQATLDRQRIEADIKATQERIRIAEEQGNEQLALQERQRLDQLQIALGQQGIQEAQVSGYYGGRPTFAREQYATELQAAPKDWAKAWMYQRGQDPNTPLTVPPWLQNVALNKPSALYQGTSGGLGTFPIKAPDPLQVSAKTFQTMAPSEQEGLMGLAQTSGWYIPDYIKQMQNSWQRQNIRPADVWAGGY